MTALTYPSPNGASEPRPASYEDILAENARLRQENARVTAERDRCKARAEDTQKQLSSVTTLLGCPKFTDSQKIRMWAVMHATQHAAASADPDGWCNTSLYDIVTVAGIPVTPADETEEARKKALGNAFSTASKAVTMAAEMGLIERGEPTYYHDDPVDPRRITGCKQPVRLLASPDEAFRRAMLQAPEPAPKKPRGRHVKLPRCPNCQSENLHIKCADCGYYCTGEEYAVAQLASEEKESPGLQILQTEDTDYTGGGVSAERGNEDDAGLQNLQSGTKGAQTTENGAGAALPLRWVADEPDPNADSPLDTVPQELRDRPQWVCCRGKEPIDPKTGLNAKSNDPRTWGTFEQALAAVERYNLRDVGYMFSEDDPYTGFDADHCRNPETGELAEKLIQAVRWFDSYTEISPSEDGIHTIMKAKKPGSECKGKLGGYKVELYDHGRYFRMTGRRLPGTPATIEHRQRELEQAYAAIFPAKVPLVERNGHARQGGALGEREILTRAQRGANGAKFDRLWRGDWAGYPSPSEADAAFCRLLALSGADAVQIDALWRGSGLATIPRGTGKEPADRKWERYISTWGMTYGEHTVRSVLA